VKLDAGQQLLGVWSLEQFGGCALYFYFGRWVGLTTISKRKGKI